MSTLVTQHHDNGVLLVLEHCESPDHVDLSLWDGSCDASFLVPLTRERAVELGNALLDWGVAP